MKFETETIRMIEGMQKTLEGLKTKLWLDPDGFDVLDFVKNRDILKASLDGIIFNCEELKRDIDNS